MFIDSVLVVIMFGIALGKPNCEKFYSWKVSFIISENRMSFTM